MLLGQSALRVKIWKNHSVGESYGISKIGTNSFQKQDYLGLIVNDLALQPWVNLVKLYWSKFYSIDSNI